MKAVYEHISGGTLLLVGDDVNLCLLLKVYFLRKGCQVFIAHTLEEALYSAGQIVPDCVIVTLATIDSNENITGKILQQAPGVQLLVVNNEVVFDKKG